MRFHATPAGESDRRELGVRSRLYIHAESRKRAGANSIDPSLFPSFISPAACCKQSLRSLLPFFGSRDLIFASSSTFFARRPRTHPLPLAEAPPQKV